MSIKKIFDELDNLISVILKNNYNESGLTFLTEEQNEIQVAHISYSAGHTVGRHFHPNFERKILKTMECLFVKTGEIEITFYNDNKAFICTEILKKGDLVLFLGGGHGINYSLDSQLIEIRQGPYLKEYDKSRF